jgi:hypothetical protein
MQEFEWVLLAFDKYTEELVRKYSLAGLDVAIVEAIFRVPPDIAPYGSIPVRLEHINQLRRYTDAEFDTQKYDYFVECA